MDMNYYQQQQQHQYRLARVGNFSPLEMSTEFFMVPSTASVSNSVGHVHHQSTATTATVYRSPVPMQSTFFRREVWVPPLLVLSSLTMLLIVLFEVFVLCKTWRTVPSRRHLFLGQMLLSGLFVCSAVSAVITAEPTVVTCAIVRFGIGFGYSLVFSTLLVKCVFLISLNGGVYLPAPYQALLLFFTVAIQIAIDVQWLINTPPKIVQGGVSNQACQTPYHHMLFSLVYVVFLIIVVTVLAMKSRGIRDNYREAMFIAIALSSVIPVWIGWSVSGFMAYEKNRDACLAFGLSITAIIVFLIMFMPKGRQLAAMGREGMYIEDRDDKFSTISRPASPSFFHFKPVKPTFSMSKHPSAMNTYGAKPPGNLKMPHPWNGNIKDRVALVAAPPTYAHHYYPCCYFPQPHTHSRSGPPGSGVLEPNLYTTVEPTLSSNPNVFFHRSGLHSGMMY